VLAGGGVTVGGTVGMGVAVGMAVGMAVAVGTVVGVGCASITVTWSGLKRSTERARGPTTRGVRLCSPGPSPLRSSTTWKSRGLRLCNVGAGPEMVTSTSGSSERSCTPALSPTTVIGTRTVWLTCSASMRTVAVTGCCCSSDAPLGTARSTFSMTVLVALETSIGLVSTYSIPLSDKGVPTRVAEAGSTSAAST